MKTFLAFLISLCSGIAGANAHSSTMSPPKKPPFKGMTKAQAFTRYGEPFHQGHVDGRDVWYYHLKFDEVYGREFVPFAVSSDNVTLGEIAFDRNDRVAHYVWNYTNIR